jgi:uncharacterized protein
MALDLRLDRIAALCRDYGVLELDGFGSVARGEATDESDIDFLYVLSDPSIGMRLVEFQRRPAEILGRDVDNVDLVPKHYLNRVIRDRVPAGARPVYAAA